MIEIIAEIGINHNGDYATACALADMAKRCGCDIVKTQLWDTERVYPRDKWDEMKALELSRGEIAALKAYCDSIDIEFLCTPDEIEDAYFLKEIGVKRIKTSSQDVTNLVYLRQIGELGLPVILSTGASTEDEMLAAIVAVGGYGYHRHDKSNPLTVLHCISCYPAPLNQMNLLTIAYLRSAFHGRIGLSDHSEGLIAALIALGMGATMFEKHITFDNFAPGPDHHASADEIDLVEYVTSLRLGDRALGDGIKRIMPCEVDNRKRYDVFTAPRKVVTC